MKNVLKKIILSTAAVSLTLAVSGCSGGGSGGIAGGISSAFSGIGIDGILVGSTVCIDANANNACDAGEPFAITDSLGKFSIAATTATGPLLLVGGVDNSTGQAFTGSLKAPAGSTVVTPLTSAVQSLVEGGQSAASAEATIKTAMGLPDIDLTNFDPYAQIGDANATNAGYAKTILAKQTQLQILVHSATVTVAGADANTDVNSTMSSVFDALVANYKGATGAVTLDAAKVTAATKTAADTVYANNPTARVVAKVVAQTSAENSVRDADNAESTISNGTVTQATTNLDNAITKVNTTAETELQAAANTAKTAAALLTATQIQAIEDSQKLQQEKEAATIVAQAAQNQANDDATAAQLAFAQNATKATYDAKLAAEALAAKAATDKATADEAAANAAKLAAIEEQNISAQAAQREAQAAAAETQAAAEKAQAQAEQAAAEQAETDASAASDLAAAQTAAAAAATNAAATIAQAGINTNVQIAHAFAVQAAQDANATQVIAALVITGISADANATTANIAATAAATAATDANITLPADNNISAAVAFKDEAHAQANIAAAALADAQIIKSNAQLSAATQVAIDAKRVRIIAISTDVNATVANATSLLSDANATAILADVNASEVATAVRTIFTLNASYALGTIATDANNSATNALALLQAATAEAVKITTAKTTIVQAISDVNETAAQNAQTDANNAFATFTQKLTEARTAKDDVLSKLAQAQTIKGTADTAEAARVAAAINASASIAQASLNTAIQAASDANASATAAGVSATQAGTEAASNANAASAASSAQAFAQTAGTQASEAKIAADLAASTMLDVFTTNVADINETGAASAASLIASFTESAVAAKNAAATAATNAAAQLVLAQNATPPVVANGGLVDGLSFTGFDQNDGKITTYEITLSGGTLSEIAQVLNTATGLFETNLNPSIDYRLINGNWIDNTNNLAYTLSNGIATFTQSGESVKIDRKLNLTSPSSTEELAVVSGINALVPGSTNVAFSAGAEAYVFSFKNIADKFTLFWAPTNCSDYNNTTNTCNVTATPYATLVEFMNANNSVAGTRDASNNWVGVEFQRNTSGGTNFYASYPAIDASGGTISSLSVDTNGSLVTVDNNNTETIVGTWKVIDLPSTAGLAILLTPDSAHLAAFDYPTENLVAVKSSMVYRGERVLASPNFRVETTTANNNINLNPTAFADVAATILTYVTIK